MNDITREFKKAAEERYEEIRLHYIRHTQFACSNDLHQFRQEAKEHVIKNWVKEGRDMREVDFNVWLDVNFSIR